MILVLMLWLLLRCVGDRGFSSSLSIGPGQSTRGFSPGGTGNLTAGGLLGQTGPQSARVPGLYSSPAVSSIRFVYYSTLLYYAQYIVVVLFVVPILFFSNVFLFLLPLYIR